MKTSESYNTSGKPNTAYVLRNIQPYLNFVIKSIIMIIYGNTAIA